MQEKGVNEVHTGGLSSFSLVNMVIAHLMAEGYKLKGQPQADLETDLGKLLWGFLVRFGVSFDYYDQAVSITRVRHRNRGFWGISADAWEGRWIDSSILKNPCTLSWASAWPFSPLVCYVWIAISA